MHVAVINFSGNVGKSTITRHLLVPRMNNCRIFNIETLNASGGQGNQEFSEGKEIINTIISASEEDQSVIDIGSSNVESVIKVLDLNPGMHAAIDYFLIPVVPDPKQQLDTLGTINALHKLGIEPEAIRVVFNRLEKGSSAKTVFEPIFKAYAAQKRFTMTPAAVITENPFYKRLANSKITIADIASDETDYKAANRNATDREEKRLAMEKFALKVQAVAAQTELDEVYSALFAEAVV